MPFRPFVLALASTLVGCAALAATDPPPSDELATVAHRLLDLLERGGPAVVALEVAFAVAFLALLASVVLVLITVVQNAPRIARPIADAVATMRGGRTEREEALEAEIAELRAEVAELKARERLHLDRFEEQGRNFRVLIEALRAAGAELHLDLDALAASFSPAGPSCGACVAEAGHAAA